MITRNMLRGAGLVLATAAVTVATWLAVGLAAANAGTYRWPTNRVTYCDATHRYGPAVHMAAKWWNDTPANVRLVRRPCWGAAIVVRRTWRRAYWSGLAYYPPRGDILLNARWLDKAWMGRVDRADTAAHEFGHALGLPHGGGRCRLMYGGANDLSECRGGVPDDMFRCGPQRGDVYALIARYGGRIGGFQGTLCEY